MVQTTKWQQSVKEVEQFYDAVADDYDAMTGFGDRFKKESENFLHLVQRFKISTALDAGCGTGFHSLLLALLGVEVTAVDCSREMLRYLKHHATMMQLQIKTLQTTFDALAASVDQKYDGVLCLGNTLVHFPHSVSLNRALKNFHSVVRPGGTLILQSLNYSRILTEKNKILASRETDTSHYIRSYEYGEGVIHFSIEKRERETVSSTSLKKNTIAIRPYLKDEIVSACQKAGFTDVVAYGDLLLSYFSEKESNNVVVIGRK